MVPAVVYRRVKRAFAAVEVYLGYSMWLKMIADLAAKIGAFLVVMSMR